MSASKHAIRDDFVLGRIQTIAERDLPCAFFYAASDNQLLVLAITKQGGSHLIRLGSFVVDGKLPEGAFATSVGAWFLEKKGKGVNPSAVDLLQLFLALK